ncbi:uncharacterized protein METZ01_LOCUS415873, partial [marine metagenome]
MKLTVLASYSLDGYLAMGIQPDTHFLPPIALIDLIAPSFISFAVIRSNPALASIFLPSSTFVPAKRTINGTPSFVSLAAVIIPSAMKSHLMIPPNMLTKMAFTPGSDNIIRNPSATCSA